MTRTDVLITTKLRRTIRL